MSSTNTNHELSSNEKSLGTNNDLTNFTKFERGDLTKPKRVRLNKSNVDAIPYSSRRQMIYRDTDIPGFGLRVTAASKTYICEYWLPELNKSVRASLGKHGKITVDEARRKAKKLLGLSADGIDANEEKRKRKADETTLREVWQQYQQVRKLRPKTIKVYESALSRGLGDWLDKPVARITRAMIKIRQRDLGRAVGPRSSAAGATENANQIMRVLRSMLIFARDEYVTEDERELRLPDGFATGFPKAFPKKRRHRRIEDSDLAAWYEALHYLSSDSIRDMLILCLFTGLRRGESSNLTWDKVNLKDGIIMLAPADTKNHEPHRVYLSNFLVSLLQWRKDKSEPENIYVFPSHVNGKPIGEPKSAINKVTERTGIAFSTHDLRRTYLSIAQSIEAPYAVSKILANHKRGSDITESYMTISPEQLRNYQEKITARLLELIELDSSK